MIFDKRLIVSEYISICILYRKPNKQIHRGLNYWQYLMSL